MPVLVVDGARINVDEARVEGSVHGLVVDGQPVRVELVEEFVKEPYYSSLKNRGEIHPDLSSRFSGGEAVVRVNGRPFDARVEQGVHSRAIGGEGQSLSGPVLVMAPMAGRIVTLKIVVGSEAGEGDALVVLEAMKMENEVASPRRGVVKELYVRQGDLVKAGDRLCVIE